MKLSFITAMALVTISACAEQPRQGRPVDIYHHPDARVAVCEGFKLYHTMIDGGERAKPLSGIAYSLSNGQRVWTWKAIEIGNDLFIVMESEKGEIVEFKSDAFNLGEDIARNLH